MRRVLVIDDEEAVRARLCELLGAAGFDVVVAPNAREGICAAVGGGFDLILLDLVLSDDSGEHVLHSILSSHPEAQVVIVSAVTDAGRRAGAFDMGAADFIQKPFGDIEVLARIRARLRANAPEYAPARDLHPVGSSPVAVLDVARDARAASSSNDRSASRSAVLTRPTSVELPVDSDYHVDVFRRTVIAQGRRVELSQREFLLMCYLLRRKGQVCTRQELLAAVWGIDFQAQTNVVDVYIRRLRSKLAIDTIDTIRKVGYRLSAA